MGVLGVGLVVVVILFPGSPLAPRTLAPNFAGVGLGAYRAPPITLLESLGAPTDGRVVGVEPAICGLLNGDSGRGSDGLNLGLKSGLRARPGPTD